MDFKYYSAITIIFIWKRQLQNVAPFCPSLSQYVWCLLQSNPAPCVIRDTTTTRIWYRQDDKYLLPKAFVSMELIR